MKKIIKSMALLILLSGYLLLSGCAQMLTERSLSESPLEDITVDYEAPQGDLMQERMDSAVLHFLNYDKTQLAAQVRTITIPGGMREAQAVLEALMDGPRSGLLSQIVPPEVRLQNSSSAIELSAGVATISLNAQARKLAPQVLYAAKLAITNTLTELSSIDYVNILIEGREEGLDLASTIPTGTQTRVGSVDINAQWMQIEGQSSAGSEQTLSRLATLYYPVSGGPYVVPEVRNVSLPSLNRQDYVLTLLQELGKSMTTNSDAPSFPAPIEYLASLPEIVQLENTGVEVVKLEFTDELDEALQSDGIIRGVYLATLTNTITCFVPGIDGLSVYIGDEKVTSMEGTQTVDGYEVIFENAVISRAYFYDYVADYGTLYFPSVDTGNLVRIRHPLLQRQIDQPRVLIRALLKGPDEDEKELVGQVFPSTISDADFLGLQIVEDALLINLSQSFVDACKDLTRIEERNLVYAIVNTMTQIDPIKRVYFFTVGEQMSTLSGALEMKGAFYRNPGIIKKYD